LISASMEGIRREFCATGSSKNSPGCVWNATNPSLSASAKQMAPCVHTMNPHTRLTSENTQNGKGIFASTPFLKNELIFQFCGEYYTYAQLPQPYNTIEDHYMQIGHNLYIGPSGDFDDLFNHSCEPNAGITIRGTNVQLIAIRDISPTEEITWDYSTTMDENDWEMNCACGSKNCRGRIRDFKHLPQALQEKYRLLKIVPTFILENLSV